MRIHFHQTRQLSIKDIVRNTKKKWRSYLENPLTKYFDSGIVQKLLNNLSAKMRKIVSIVFLVVFLFTIPGLINNLNGGTIAVSALFLGLGIYLWKPAKSKTEETD